MAKLENDFLVFSLDKDLVYRMFGDDWVLAYNSNGTVTFYAIGNPGQKSNYGYETLNRLNASGQIEVQPFAQLPEHLRPVQGNTLDDVFLSGVNPARRKRAEGRHAMVQTYLALREKGELKAVDSQIEDFMPRIREEAEVYLAENLPDPEYDLKVNAWRNGTGRKPRSKGMVTLPDKVSASQLRKWAFAFKKGGKKALLDNIDKRGNHNSYFTTDEMALLAKVVNSEYMNRQKKAVRCFSKSAQQALNSDTNCGLVLRMDPVVLPVALSFRVKTENLKCAVCHQSLGVRDQSASV